ncbi:MAG: hypothetical protein OMM_09432 [Candidatus Magnetoglobus multicellularis str. Araruama]|uniref:Dockerin domain-containing protein n=1 Tax=Candidatus Magnetoglobus multicellularis str. Araruama TaxID=890399 RepID=A0A1V1P481_9BACT|nr:MAG: hypothetical protein OMM_09432 [Candidatus Magnetoglobus multicellularis str. Araruama]
MEVIVSSGDYALRGASSARVAIRDNQSDILSGDIDNSDGLNLKDAIIALQICAGKKDMSAIFVASSVDKEHIGLKDVLYILNNIAGK